MLTPFAVIGFPALALCLLVEGILQWQYLGTNNKPGLAACVVFIYIYIIMVCIQLLSVEAPR